MSKATEKTLPLIASRRTFAEALSRAWKFRGIYALAVIPLAYFIVIKYGPLWNAQIAFKEFSPLDGVWGSPITGLANFESFFNSIYFFELMRNTLLYSFAKLLLGLPAALLLALAIYECGAKRFARFVQTLTYLPHFLSWVIMLGVLGGLLSQVDGLVNSIISSRGGQPVNFMGSPDLFPFVIILSDIWKEMGWSAIIFLAALIAIDPVLFEAARVEGAGPLQRLRHVVFPGIADVVVIVVLLKIGTILDAGFHQIFVLYSMPVYSVSDIIDTWVYRQGVLDFQFGLATAVGLFKGVFGMLLLMAANRLARRFAGSGLY